ncbi:DUF2029 domain-containing protein [Gordonia sp. TBRC 11910]|uniref:DUF2029 domain-containing protein n=1 Tax=Gordonia asplenii TaxID=2725283 RepID=A0A848KNA9_9ACTN|nr:glycosyltransferase 87 family protein [Gordonia asplenii]NMO00166.1 DUF2029 domain-containing protein [Gordonia asplenii]
MPLPSPPSARQIAEVAAGFAVLISCVAIGFAIPLWRGYIDLQVYRDGATMWLDGDLYSVWAHVDGIWLPFTYPPLAAVVFAPLTVLSLPVAEAVVFLASIAALTFTLWLILRRIAPGMDRYRALAIVLGAAGLSVFLEPVRENLSFGQVNIVLMAMVTFDTLTRSRRWPRGVLIGVAMAVKLTPAGFLLYFLVKRDWRALATAVTAGIVATGVGWALAPDDSRRYWLHVVSDTSRIGQPFYATNQSLKGMLFRLGLSGSAATVLWLTIGLACVVLGGIWMRRLFDADDEVSALLVNAVVLLLISPVSWSHHWVWVAPAILVFGHAIMTGRVNRGLAWAGGGACVVYAVGAHLYLPRHHGVELTWSWWQQIIGNGFALAALAILIAGATLHRPTRPVGP